MKFSDFENWYNDYRHLLPDEYTKGVEKFYTHIEFSFRSKEYEALATPKLRALMYEQFPELKNAPASLEPHLAKNVEHRIFETAEKMWRIIRDTREGKSAAQAMPKLYPQILQWKKEWDAPPKVYTLEDIAKEHNGEVADEDLKGLMEHRNNSAAERHAAQLEFRQQFQHRFFEVMQEDLLNVFPELMDMEADWWIVYVYVLRGQCNFWKDQNDRYEFFAEHGLGAEWLNKPFAEYHKKIERLARLKRKSDS